jgi:hypothetical protein
VWLVEQLSTGWTVRGLNPSGWGMTMTTNPHLALQLLKEYSYTQGHIYAQAKGAQTQGGILKKIKIEEWYAGKKRLSTREKFNPLPASTY